MSAAPTALAASPHSPILPARRTVAAWLIVAVLNFVSQVALRRELIPGEFGTVNTVLGLVAVLAAPLLALDFLLAHHMLPEDEATRWRSLRPAMMELGALAWGCISIALIFALLPLLVVPRFSLSIFALLALPAALLTVFSASRCATEDRTRFWTTLVIAAAAARLLGSVVFAWLSPWAQSGLAAVVVAGLVTAVPAMRKRAGGPTRSEAWTTAREPRFLKPFLAAASVMAAIALFTNADRLAAQPNFGWPYPENFNYVDGRRFDDYQAAGLLARALLWGTLPLLLVVYARRSALERTSKTSLHFFWIYLFALFGGDLLLGTFAPFLSWIFTGDAVGAARFIPGFAGAVPMLGLLQGVGIFVLASRRYPECFVLGGCSLAYTLFLLLCGREPQLMTSCMFGGALISLTLVLLVGIVRYARTHP